MHRLATAAVLTSAVVLHGQTSPLSRSSADQIAIARGATSGSASIRGRVVDANGLTPLRNAAVALLLDSRPFSILLTEADGRFAATSLPPGRYVLSAAKAGYVKTTLSTERRTPQRIDVAEGAAVAGIEIRLPRGAAISGRIADDTGEPLVGAVVTAESVGDNGRTSASAETDDLGAYRIGGLPQSRFLVAAILFPSPGGMITLQLGGVTLQNAAGAGGGIAAGRIGAGPRLYYPGVATSADAQPIDVHSGEERAAVDFILPFAQPDNDIVVNGLHLRASDDSALRAIEQSIGRQRQLGGTSEVGGRVIRTDGRPIRRAQVRLEPLDPSRFPEGTATDDTGTYRFMNVRAGEYTLSASRRGFVSVRFGQRELSERGDAVTLAAGERRERVDIALSRYGTVTGHVLDENGDPMEGARVQLVQIRFQGGRQQLVEAGPAATRSDDQGRYRIHDVPAGQYIVQASVGHADRQHTPFESPIADVPGYAPTFYPGAARVSDARFIAVGVSEDLAGMDFAMARVPTARISGHAFTSTGESVKGGLLLVPSQRSGAVIAQPIKPDRMFAPDGSFEFADVPPGEYVLQATMGRPTMTAEGEFSAQYVNVDGTAIDGIVIRTSPGSTISGRVTFEGADPPRPREIGLTPVPVDADLTPRFGDASEFGAGPPGRGEVRDDWTFQIAGISGPRRLQLTSPPAGWALKAVYLNGVDVTDQALVFGTKDQSVNDLQVVLTNRPTAVEGIVSDAQGRPARECLVVAFPTDRELRTYQSRYLDRSVCQQDGSFIIRRLPPGQYLLAAIAWRSNDNGEAQDPQLLEALAPRATRVILLEGQRLLLSLRQLAR